MARRSEAIVHDRAGAPRRILLAEDHPVSQRVVTAMLENLGFRVDAVGDGAQAVRAAAASSYHAILMDCQLPLIDGYQATAAIRRLQGTTRRTPIIAVTASDGQTEREECLAAGMDDCLTKPLSLRVLGAALSRWVGDDRRSTLVEGTSESPSSARADATAAGEPVLDVVIVGRLARVGSAAGQDLIGQLTRLFLDDANARVADLRRALAVDDDDAVVRTAHALGGASANLGATHMARVCATLTTNAKAGDLTDGTALLDAVEVELGRVRSALGSLALAS
jgi:CheY-like chemotaxis protein/HPt (histidine-containing phosphotransfer) domain-containing protein